MSATWRDSAAPIIARVIREHRGEEEKLIRLALYHAYPFGMRRYHPYRIWCDEINRQLHGRKTKAPDPRQQDLFA